MPDDDPASRAVRQQYNNVHNITTNIFFLQHDKDEKNAESNQFSRDKEKELRNVLINSFKHSAKKKKKIRTQINTIWLSYDTVFTLMF